MFTDKKPQSNVFETVGYVHANTWMRGVKSTTQTSMPPVPMFEKRREKEPEKKNQKKKNEPEKEEREKEMR